MHSILLAEFEPEKLPNTLLAYTTGVKREYILGLVVQRTRVVFFFVP